MTILAALFGAAVATFLWWVGIKLYARLRPAAWRAFLDKQFPPPAKP